MSTIVPTALIRSLRNEFQFEEEAFFKTHETGDQVTSVRINPYKEPNVFSKNEQVPWCPQGRYLDQRPSFIADPYFHAGCYYVQEASSMFLHHILKSEGNLGKSMKILDLCASPGGKSTLISSLINQESILVSNEIIKSRVPALTDNLTKWGVSNVFVTNNDPKDFSRLNGYFNIMVVDAPCSGSGMFRKDPGAINEWSESAVMLCSQRQQRILADSYSALQNDGLLIYSTCSYSREENEDIADWLCDHFDATPLKIPIAPDWGIAETRSSKHGAPGYRFYPHKVKGEGFFVCCFRKNEGTVSEVKSKQRPESPAKKEEEIIFKWVNREGLAFIKYNQDLFAIPETAIGDFKILQTSLYLKKSGTRVGRIAGKDLVPDHELALSLILHPAIHKTNLSKEEAWAYLRKDELKLNSDFNGWTLMCYNNQALGWAKILPNRINNYYPKEQRILKDFKDLQ
ncbi:MAG TPA: RNA methyltransferase [Sphingobacteriaceae bacterium]